MNTPDRSLEALPALLRAARERSERLTALIAAQLGPDPSKWARKCGACGVGMVGLDLSETAMSSRDGLVLVFVRCPECRLRERMRKAGVPANLVHATVENFAPTCAADEPARVKVAAYQRAPAGYLFLTGTQYGNGKSHLAASVMRTHLARDLRGRWMTGAEFLRDVRRRYDDRKEEDVVETARTVPLLVFDEFGLSVGGRDELPTLHEVFDRRYGDRLPTVLTANLSPEQFGEAIGPRMADRLREGAYAWITLTGPTFREGNRTNYLRQKSE